MFAFSAIKGPAKELRLAFLSGEKYLNKMFVLFSGSESDELSLDLTFQSRELSFKMKPAEDFFKFNPPPAWISRVFDPPSRENLQNPIRRGGADFFWNNPIYRIIKQTFYTSHLGLYNYPMGGQLHLSQGPTIEIFCVPKQTSLKPGGD